MNKVVCIYNNKSNLTINKVYNVEKKALLKSTNGKRKPNIKVVNDKGIEQWYGINRFRNLNEHRFNKINKILD